MAKKRNNQNPATGNSTVKNQANVQKPVATRAIKSAPVSESFITRYSQLFIVSGIALVTFLFYATILGNKLTNWDDLGYIISNSLIRDNSAEGIKRIFSTDNPVMGNYHPLTIMLYAFEYGYKGLDPFIYHFDSLILHVLVTISVYFFVRGLTHRTIAAAITALLFGLHPMHVESVAWAAGRKDVLYGLFFILSCTTYVNYLRAEGSKKMIWYLSGIVLFAISLLAKSVAVSLPITLFLIDFYEKRKWSLKILIDKIPHLALALLFGILSIQAQDKIGALASLDVKFNPLERFALGAYALCTYLWKAVLPLGLSNFYPYPLKENGALPGSYYVYPVILIALVAALWRFGRKNNAVIFGVGFFMINIFLLLQFIPVGGAIISDRYGYVPYLGLFFMAGWFVSGFFEGSEKSSRAKLALGVSLAYCLALGVMTNERSKDWHDSISLWTDDREKHPEAPVAYFYLGQEYDTQYDAATEPKEKQTDLDSAYYYFVKAIEHKPDYLNAIICLAELQRNMGQIDLAKANYDKALKINNKSDGVYLGLGIVYTIKKQYDSAAYCFKTTIQLKPNFPEAHSNYANFLDIIGQTDSSLKEYATSIKMNAGAQDAQAYIPYMNRARIYMVERGQFDAAINDYNKVIELKPEMGETYYLRSKCYFQKGNKTQARQDADKAIALGYPKVEQSYIQQLK